MQGKAGGVVCVLLCGRLKAVRAIWLDRIKWLWVEEIELECARDLRLLTANPRKCSGLRS